jgi:hypothetical protein
MDEIINRVEKSGVVAVDLADFLPRNSDLKAFDFAPFLWNELVLKEKDFREQLKALDWTTFSGKHVYLHCSVDAILPSWSFMLVTSYLTQHVQSITIGDERAAKQTAIEQTIRALDKTTYIDAKLIVKGCSDLPNPEAIMSLFLQQVQPVCSSFMYGEPCSTVPIYKRPKQ